MSAKTLAGRLAGHVSVSSFAVVQARATFSSAANRTTALRRSQHPHELLKRLSILGSIDGRVGSLSRLASTSAAPASKLPSSTALTTTKSYFSEDDSEFNPRGRPPPPWYSRPIVWVLACVPVLTLYLGIWQIKRLWWKLDLIDELESKLKREPLSLPKNIDLDVLLTQFPNRLFALSGRFPSATSDSVVFLGPRVRDGQVGYHVIQPFERDVGGGLVLIDRGFVAKEKIVNYQDDPKRWRLADAAADSALSPSSSHLVLLPPKKERNSFTPPNDLQKRSWHFADVDELVRFFSDRQRQDPLDEQDHYTPSHGISESVRGMLGLSQAPGSATPAPFSTSPVLPAYFEEIFEGNVADAARNLQAGIPIGRAATVELRNQHAVYAATWFSLSAATSVMLALLIRRAPK